MLLGDTQEALLTTETFILPEERLPRRKHGVEGSKYFCEEIIPSHGNLKFIEDKRTNRIFLNGKCRL